MTAIDVLVSGRVYSDLVFSGAPIPSPGAEVYADAFTISPGGAANRAVAASRLGATTSLLSEFGDDPIGRIVEDMLRAEPDLDLSGCRRLADHQSPISVAITDGPERSFVTFELPATELAWHGALPRTAHVGVGEEVPAWARELRERGCLLFGGVGWDASGLWSDDLLARLAGVDAIVFNEIEALSYTRAATAEDALEVLAAHVGVVVVTLGADGALAADGSDRVRVPAPRVAAVDPTGAGDAFTGAFMASTAWGWSLADRTRLAVAVAACTVRGAGGARSTPTPAQVGELLAAQTDPDWDAVRDWARHQNRSALPDSRQGTLA
ncbi:MAG: PfkB family carbohydrate kinase [Microbacterium enclense]